MTYAHDVPDYFFICAIQMLIEMFAHKNQDPFEALCVSLCVYSPVGRMAMQFVATQMMSTVWNGPSTSQIMKPPVSTFNNLTVLQSSVPGKFLLKGTLVVPRG